MLRLISGNFYYKSAFFAGASIAAAVINYLLYPALSKMLKADEFGEFAVIISLSAQVMGALIAFNILSIYVLQKYEERKAKRVLAFVQQRVIQFFIGLFFAALLAAPAIMHFFRLENTLSLPAVFIILLSAVPATFWSGYLQGKKRLIEVGLYILLNSILKIALITLLAMSFGLSGAVTGLVTASLLSLACLYWLGRGKLPSIWQPGLARGAIGQITKPYILPIIVIVTLMAALQNLDVLLARRLFSPYEAGLYANIGLLSNAVYYLGFLMVWIILPEVTRNYRAHNIRLVRNVASFICLVAVVALATAWFLGELYLKLIYGESSLYLTTALLYAVIYQALLSLTVFSVYYFLIIDKIRLAASCTLLSVVLCAAAGSIQVESPEELTRRLALAICIPLLLVVYNVFYKKIGGKVEDN